MTDGSSDRHFSSRRSRSSRRVVKRIDLADDQCWCLLGTRGAAWCPGPARIVIFSRAGNGGTLAVAMSGDGKDAMEPGFAAAEIDTSRPHPARMYNAYLGGNDNYPADRAAVRQILRDFPEVRGIALANRAFLQRAVRFLAAEAGIRQFIDIGTGMCASYCVPFHALCGLGSDVCGELA